MTRTAISVFALTVVLTAASLTLAAADIYSGSLTSADGGLLGTGVWVDNPYLAGSSSVEEPLVESSFALGDWQPATISWQVQRNLDNSWHYVYDLQVWQKEISHFILEVSRNFTIDNIWNAEGPFKELEVGWFSPGPGNPHMPEQIYGIKFDDMWGSDATLSFYSDRNPVWGDFYSKNGISGGVWNTVWNAGFTIDDWDPPFDPQDGSLSAHVLVPNGDTVPIPEPGTLVLLSLGTCALAARLRRRRS